RSPVPLRDLPRYLRDARVQAADAAVAEELASRPFADSPTTSPRAGSCRGSPPSTAMRCLVQDPHRGRRSGGVLRSPDLPLRSTGRLVEGTALPAALEIQYADVARLGCRLRTPVNSGGAFNADPEGRPAFLASSGLCRSPRPNSPRTAGRPSATNAAPPDPPLRPELADGFTVCDGTPAPRRSPRPSLRSPFTVFAPCTTAATTCLIAPDRSRGGRPA
ncbi:hypothetical protein ACU686_18760, partial [Yinghuangia aomiensis]